MDARNVYVVNSLEHRLARSPVRGIAQKVDDWCARDPLRFVLATWLLIAGVLVLRRPTSLIHAQFWAEDALVFYHDRLLFGPFATITLAHAGYPVVLDRLIADFAAPFPTIAAPTVYNLCAFALSAASIAPFALPIYRYLLRSDLARVLVVLLAASATSAYELIGNVTNLQWFLTAGGLLLIALPPRVFAAMPIWGRVALCGVGALVFASSPLLIITLPLLIVQIVRRRGRPTLSAVLTGTLVAEFAFAWYAAHLPDAQSVPTGVVIDHSLGAIVGLLPATAIAFAYRSGLTLTVGDHAAKAASELGLVTPPIVILAAALTVMIWLLKTSRGLRRLTVIASLYLIVASIAFAVLVRHLAPNYARITGITDWGGERYFMLASFITVLLVVTAAQRLRERGDFRREFLAFVLPIAAFAGGVVSNYEVAPLIDLRWRAYTPVIDQWRWAHDRGRESRAVAVPINPGGAWFMDLPAIKP